MNKYETRKKITAPTPDEMFGLDETLGDIINVNVDKLKAYHTNGANPFSMERNKNFEELLESIKEDGIRTPITVRVDPDDDMKYEIISGHRRTEAARELGIEKIPAVVLELDDDEAQKSVVLSNKHREKILPSEKAKAYKMYLEAKTRQGKRSDLTLGPGDPKLRSSESVAEELGIGEKTVRRYAKLTELIPELMKMIDDEKVPVKTGEQLAYIDEEGQNLVKNIIGENNLSPSVEEATEIKKLFKEGNFTEDNIRECLGLKKMESLEEFMNRPKTEKKVKITEKSVTDYLPPYLHKEPVELKYDYISKALTQYNRYLEEHLDEKKEWEEKCIK